MIVLWLIVLGTVAGFAGGVVAACFMEAYFIRRSDNEIYETQFAEDTTKHDVPEWSKDD